MCLVVLEKIFSLIVVTNCTILCDQKVEFYVPQCSSISSYVVAKHYVDELIQHTFKLELTSSTSLPDMKAYPTGNTLHCNTNRVTQKASRLPYIRE